MPEIISPTTELEAVNEMLASIGQAPVNTLEVTGISDVNIAKQRLTQQTRRVLLHGFAFNTDDDYELSPNVDGIIVIPANALRLEASGLTNEYVQRRHSNGSMCLYNRNDQTFEFDEPVECKINWGFPFDDLPEVARSYIAVAAARRFQSKFLGSQILDKFEEEDEMRAWVNLERAERATRRTNLFRGNTGVSSKINNRSY